MHDHRSFVGAGTCRDKLRFTSTKVFLIFHILLLEYINFDDIVREEPQVIIQSLHAVTCRLTRRHKNSIRGRFRRQSPTSYFFHITMSDYNYQAPNLASILANLANLSSQSQVPPQTRTPVENSALSKPSQSYLSPVPHGQTQSIRSQTPPSAPPEHDHYHQIWQQQLDRASQAPQAQEPAPASSRKIIDPATIVEWSAGLRCVMKTVAIHENVLNDIRRMIKTQHEHEEQWFKGREELIKRQMARAEGQKKLDEVM
jgi:hypothetical protein